MNNSLPQPDRLTAECLGHGESRERHLSTFQVCMIVVLVLVVHCLGMHWIVRSWPGGEAGLARGQSPTAGNVSQAATSKSTSTLSSDDGWRRTANGWEQLNRSAPRPPYHSPSHHIELVQIWPAAAAACMVLSMLGFSYQLEPLRRQRT